MQMVDVGPVRMGMPQRFMPVAVAVRPDRDRFMAMRMVAIVMPVGVLMLERLVLMFVLVRLRQVQQDAAEHQRAGRQHQDARSALAQRPGTQGADEGREGKHRPGARGTESPLRQQVAAQAQAV